MLHYQKLFQRMVEGVLVIKKGREKYKAVCDRLLGKDVLIVICAGEDGAPRKCRCVLILCV